MVKVATLGPSVRLVVLQFLVPEWLVPAVVPPKPASGDGPANLMPPAPGIKVLQSTPQVYLLPLLDGISPITGQGPYELVDAWFASALQHFGKRQVRYVFCHKDHVKPDGLNPQFLAKRDELIESLVNLTGDNLWATQGHLNPYFNQDGTTSGDQVLMLGCAGRVQTTDFSGNTIMVFRDGRDGEGRGLGPKVPMRDKVNHLRMVDGEVILEPPTPVSIQPPAMAVSS